jgi:hypothetical protein
MTKSLRHFKISGVPIDSTGKPQQGEVVIDPNHDPPLFIVRRKRGKRDYVLPLNEVASHVSQGIIKAEVAEDKPHRKFKAKRGLV